MERRFKNRTLKKTWNTVYAAVLVLIYIVITPVFSSKASGAFTFEGAFGGWKIIP